MTYPMLIDVEVPPGFYVQEMSTTGGVIFHRVEPDEEYGAAWENGFWKVYGLVEGRAQSGRDAALEVIARMRRESPGYRDSAKPEDAVDEPVYCNTCAHLKTLTREEWQGFDLKLHGWSPNLHDPIVCAAGAQRVDPVIGPYRLCENPREKNKELDCRDYEERKIPPPPPDPAHTDPERPPNWFSIALMAMVAGTVLAGIIRGCS